MMFTHTCPCRFSLTVELEVGALREFARKQGLSFYAVLIFRIIQAANSCDFMRFSWVERGVSPGIWSRIEPNFTLLNPKSHTFSSVWLPAQGSERSFVSDFAALNASVQSEGTYLPQAGGIPQFTLPISMVPWINFTSFSVELPDPLYLSPVITMGSFCSKDGGVKLPFALQLHHAVADGYHASVFLECLQQLLAPGVDRGTSP